MKDIVIVGSSGHAKVVIDAVRCEGRFRIRGLLDRFRSVGESTAGCKILGREEDLPQLTKRLRLKGVIVAIGDNYQRAKVVQLVAQLCPGLAMVRAIHPSAAVAKDVAIGDGTVVMAGACINPSSAIGAHCILNTGSSIDHDSTMDEFSSLAPGARTGGHCRLGAYSAVGIGAVLIHRVKVGEHTVIGAGATVLADIGALKIAYGVPARVIRERAIGEAYL